MKTSQTYNFNMSRTTGNMNTVTKKRTAESDCELEPPCKKNSTQLMTTGFVCSVCKNDMHDVERVIFFLGCGHLVHQKCLPIPSMCPVCRRQVTAEYQAVILLLRVVKCMFHMSAEERKQYIETASEIRQGIETMNIADFYETVNQSVYDKQMPCVEAIFLNACRVSMTDFVVTPNNKVHIMLIKDVDPTKKKWQLFDVMWQVWNALTVCTDLERTSTFKKVLYFEDMYKVVKIDQGETSADVILL